VSQTQHCGIVLLRLLQPAPNALYAPGCGSLALSTLRVLCSAALAYHQAPIAYYHALRWLVALPTHLSLLLPVLSSAEFHRIFAYQTQCDLPAFAPSTDPERHSVAQSQARHEPSFCRL